jgi:hypothetical protein
MEFSRALMSALDPESRRYGKVVVEYTAGKRGQDGRKARTWVEVEPANHSYSPGPTHSVRYYSGHVEPGNDGPTLLGWHEVWNGALTVIGHRLVLTGFAQGMQGLVWEGHPEPNRWDEHFDHTQPFVGVEWIFTH